MRGGGTRYLEEEDVKIVNYIVARKAYDRVNGSGLWNEMEKEKILESRTSRGVKARFDRVIIENIISRQNTYGLSDPEISLFCRTRKFWNALEQEEEVERGDNRPEAIRSDNTGGDSATTDGLAELEAEDVVEEVAISMDRELAREGSGSKHPAPGLVVVSYTYTYDIIYSP